MSNLFVRTSIIALGCATLLGCSKSEDSGAGKGGNSSATGGNATGGNATGGNATGGAGPTGGSSSGRGGTAGGDGGTGLPRVPGTPDDSVDTDLPPVPRLPRVTATTTGDSVSISVEPVAGARDYRVYVLPADADISSTADGLVTVRNGLYRCAGDRQARNAVMDSGSLGGGEAVKTLVDNQSVKGHRRTLDDATLGYVYVNPGDGRVPVYALGDSSGNADNACFHQRWAESRVKRYVTSEQERSSLLAERWRDDGIAFYAPADGARAIFTASEQEATLYFADGPERQARGSATEAFRVLPEAPSDADAVPLMRVHYDNGCGDDHDELMAGTPRFDRARAQGDQLPLFDLHWSGITGETVLVVEALDVGCPFQGALAPVSRPAGNYNNIDYPPFVTIEDLRAASETGEVFINGHHAESNQPRPIARSFIRVTPGPIPDMDWFAGFGPDDGTPDFMAGGFNEPCDNPDNPNCLAEYRQINSLADMSFSGAVEERNGLGVVLGELWVSYADVGADVGARFRMTAGELGQVTDDSFLHVTMEADAFSTTRRYPQIIISTGTAPVQPKFGQSETIIVQTFPDTGTTNWPFLVQVEVCDNRQWDVNDQCPSFDLYRVGGGLAPIFEVGEVTGVDRSTRFDVFLSNSRIFVFLEGTPYGCADLPASGVPTGNVSVTFGDVIYHSGVDEVMTFHENNQMIWARRHFDNLGFKNGAPQPTWDFERFPCASGFAN